MSSSCRSDLTSAMKTYLVGESLLEPHFLLRTEVNSPHLEFTREEVE
jgi:hypothetical protein